MRPSPGPNPIICAASPDRNNEEHHRHERPIARQLELPDGHAVRSGKIGRACRGVRGGRHQPPAPRDGSFSRDAANDEARARHPRRCGARRGDLFGHQAEPRGDQCLSRPRCPALGPARRCRRLRRRFRARCRQGHRLHGRPDEADVGFRGYRRLVDAGRSSGHRRRRRGADDRGHRFRGRAGPASSRRRRPIRRRSSSTPS